MWQNIIQWEKIEESCQASKRRSLKYIFINERNHLWKGYILYDSNYITLCKRQKYLASKQAHGCQGSWGRRGGVNRYSIRSFEFLGLIVFPVVMYGCESWMMKKAERWRIDAFELWCWRRLFESPLDSKEIQPVPAKGDQSWVFIGRTDAEAETPILWPPDAKNWLIGKDCNARKDWGQEEKAMTEDEMTGWHHRLIGHGFGCTPGVGDGQGSLACCGS